VRPVVSDKRFYTSAFEKMVGKAFIVHHAVGVAQLPHADQERNTIQYTGDGGSA
jgi:hypothetical protein